METFVRTRVAATWHSLELLLSKETGLPADRLEFGTTEIVVAPQTKPTNIGMGILTILCAESLQLISAQEAQSRISLILNSLSKMERYNGFFYDWYDSISGNRLTQWPQSGQVLESFISSVDNAWLAAALLVLQKAKPECANQIQQQMLAKMDFEMFVDAAVQEVWGGYNVSQDAFSPYHYSRDLVSEPRIIHWVTAALAPDASKKKNALRRLLDSHGAAPRLPAGGALFELLMPKLFVHEEYLSASLQSLFELHRAYGKAHLGGAVGVSVCDDPRKSNQYTEMGVGGYYCESSVIAAHGAALAILMQPSVALETLAQLEKVQGFYDAYGYRDAVDVATGKACNTQLFLDQAMVLLSLVSVQENAIAKLFESYFAQEELLIETLQ